MQTAWRVTNPPQDAILPHFAGAVDWFRRKSDG